MNKYRRLLAVSYIYKRKAILAKLEEKMFVRKHGRTIKDTIKGRGRDRGLFFSLHAYKRKEPDQDKR